MAYDSPMCVFAREHWVEAMRRVLPAGCPNNTPAVGWHRWEVPRRNSPKAGDVYYCTPSSAVLRSVNDARLALRAGERPLAVQLLRPSDTPGASTGERKAPTQQPATAEPDTPVESHTAVL